VGDLTVRTRVHLVRESADSLIARMMMARRLATDGGLAWEREGSAA
jgi:hypothetical protein